LLSDSYNTTKQAIIFINALWQITKINFFWDTKKGRLQSKKRCWREIWPSDSHRSQTMEI